MNRHQRRLRAKAKPVRLPPPESDNYKVLRVLLTQMPMVQQCRGWNRSTSWRPRTA